MLRRINLSAALIVLVCFFLPWEQVSCAGARDSLTGWDLARHDQALLWLVPLLMLAVLVVGVIRRRDESKRLFSVASLVCAGIVTYLMNDERTRVHNESGIISAQLTGWFWFGLLSSIGMIATAAAMLLRRRAP